MKIKLSSGQLNTVLLALDHYQREKDFHSNHINLHGPKRCIVLRAERQAALKATAVIEQQMR